MIRHYCDLCDKELTSLNRPTGGNTAGRLGIQRHNVVFSVMLTSTLPGCAPEVCKYCILDAIDTLNDRPKAP